MQQKQDQDGTKVSNVSQYCNNNNTDCGPAMQSGLGRKGREGKGREGRIG